MKQFQPEVWHTVTTRIITPEAEELVGFIKEVFHGRGILIDLATRFPQIYENKGSRK